MQSQSVAAQEPDCRTVAIIAFWLLVRWRFRKITAFSPLQLQPSMRINLKVPFAQKEAAKELGARWDPVRKLWYVVDPECLEIFSDWMPEAATASEAAGPEMGAAVRRPAASERPGVVTGAAGFKTLCSCASPPWEHCPHSQAS